MIEIDSDDLLKNAITDGLKKGIQDQFGRGYNNPLDALIASSLENHSREIRTLLENAIASAISDKSFRDEVAVAVRSKMAKTLIQRFGGEMEKQVNVLKSDPTTRARITLAIEEIVKDQSK